LGDLYITATPTFNLGKNQIRNLYYICDILPKGLGARVGSIPQESAFKLRKFPTPIRIIIYDSKGRVVSDTTQNGDGVDKMDTPLYNAKYYSHQPSSVDTITKYDEEFKEVTDSTNFVHIRKKPPIIQTIVLPPPAPIFTNSSVAMASLSQNGQINDPTTLTNDPNLTPDGKIIMQLPDFHPAVNSDHGQNSAMGSYYETKNQILMAEYREKLASGKYEFRIDSGVGYKSEIDKAYDGTRDNGFKKYDKQGDGKSTGTITGGDIEGNKYTHNVNYGNVLSTNKKTTITTYNSNGDTVKNDISGGGKY